MPTVGALGEHLASLLWSDRDAVAYRATQHLLHRVFITLQIEVTVFFISFNNPLALQKTGNPMADRMHCRFSRPRLVQR